MYMQSSGTILFQKKTYTFLEPKKVAVAPMLEGWLTHCRPQNASTVARDRRSQQKKTMFLGSVAFSGW